MSDLMTPAHTSATLSRRRCGQWLAGLMVGSLAGGGAPARAADAAGPVNVKWSIPEPRLAAAREATHVADEHISADESSVEPDKGLPLLYIAAAVLGLPVLAQGLVSVYKDWAYGSTVIDASGKTITITHDPKGSADVLVVKDKDGKVTVQEGRKSFDATKWLEILSHAVAGAAKP